MSVQNNKIMSATFVSAKRVQFIVLTVLFAALGATLPVIFHRLGIASIMFSPMHFPVLISSLLLGPISGLIVGASAVLISNVISGMPVLLPTGIAMVFELSAYGILASLVYKKAFSQNKKYLSFLISLAVAMLLGRIINALVHFALVFVLDTTYSFSQFWTSCFVISLPGILLQLAFIPLIVFAVQKSGLLEGKK